MPAVHVNAGQHFGEEAEADQHHACLDEHGAKQQERTVLQKDRGAGQDLRRQHPEGRQRPNRGRPDADRPNRWSGRVT